MHSLQLRSMAITLRPATATQALCTAQVLLTSRKAFLPYAPRTDDEVRQWVRDALVPSGGVTVACEGDVMVGMLSISQEAGIGWIDQLYLLPGHTARGIVQRFLEHALASLGRPVRLYTFQANTRARAFYERHGFKPIAFSDGSTNEERWPDVLYEL